MVQALLKQGGWQGTCTGGGMTPSSNDKWQSDEIERDKNADNSLLLFKQLTRIHQLRATESAAADAKKHPQMSSHESALGITNTFSCRCHGQRFFNARYMGLAIT